MKKQEIQTIVITIRKGEYMGSEGELIVNGEEIASGTAPSWHGVYDLLNESLDEAVWGDQGWLR